MATKYPSHTSFNEDISIPSDGDKEDTKMKKKFNSLQTCIFEGFIYNNYNQFRVNSKHCTCTGIHVYTGTHTFTHYMYTYMYMYMYMYVCMATDTHEHVQVYMYTYILFVLETNTLYYTCTYTILLYMYMYILCVLETTAPDISGVNKIRLKLTENSVPTEKNKCI